MNMASTNEIGSKYNDKIPCKGVANIFQLQISVGKSDTVCLAIFMFLLNFMNSFRF